MTLAEAVKRHRWESRLSQEAVATLIDTSRQTVMSIEKGRTVPSWAVARKLATALGFSLDSLTLG